MAESIVSLFIDRERGIRIIVTPDDPNSLGLICPAPSMAMDVLNKKIWVSQDDDVCDWAEVAFV